MAGSGMHTCRRHADTMCKPQAQVSVRVTHIATEVMDWGGILLSPKCLEGAIMLEKKQETRRDSLRSA